MIWVEDIIDMVDVKYVDQEIVRKYMVENMARKKISVRMNPKLLDDIDNLGINRSRFIESSVLDGLLKRKRRKVSDSLL